MRFSEDWNQSVLRVNYMIVFRICLMLFQYDVLDQVYIILIYSKQSLFAKADG